MTSLPPLTPHHHNATRARDGSNEDEGAQERETRNARLVREGREKKRLWRDDVVSGHDHDDDDEDDEDERQERGGTPGVARSL